MITAMRAMWLRNTPLLAAPHRSVIVFPIHLKTAHVPRAVAHAHDNYFTAVRFLPALRTHTVLHFRFVHS